jgi:NAD(P)H-hydrate repair Nnr-like enzyme with NAD(P)H-hydrate dehydratase domain
VHAHGRAADLAAQKTGLTAMAASDVIHALPAVWRVLEKRADLKRL